MKSQLGSDAATTFSVDLLFALSSALGFQFTKVELRRGIYYPRGHVEQESAERAILANLAKITSGDQPFPMKVTEFPVSPEAMALQSEFQKQIIRLANGEAVLQVSIKDKA